MEASLIISVYKDVEALKAILNSLIFQRSCKFEIIVSQDCEDPCFDDLLHASSDENRSHTYGTLRSRTSNFKGIPLQHIQQKDAGFLKTRLLNKAILVSRSEKLIFIDGDCVLHPKFISSYVKRIKQGFMFLGRRVDLDQKTSGRLRTGLNRTPSILEMLKNKSTRIEDGIYIPWFPKTWLKTPKALGCNMGWHKQDLLKINGFDGDYEHPGFGEDVDIEFRAQCAGISKKSMRFCAIQYHLHHLRPDREDKVIHSNTLFQEKKIRGVWYCKNGIDQLL
jgi:glycosyltransferase involved in cell wall biosynthesis